MTSGKDAQRRQAVIREELEVLAGGARGASVATGGGKKTAQLKGRVRRLISEELESALSKTAPAATGATGSARQAEWPRSPAPQHGADEGAARLTPLGTAQAPGAAPRTPSRSASAPDLQLPPLQRSMTPRKMQYLRNANGGFLSDVPAWQMDPSTAPCLPSQAEVLSRRMWGGLNPDYQVHPLASSASQAHAPFPGGGEPVLRAFARPRSDFVRYTEELFKAGNQQVMRKGGGTMGHAAKKA
mmetsp:Transcript_59552/g.167775  ORF Transcript_59552/g.167775 Transcript_59552/m.167775 type:complete len:243 (+) Transcript_59552:174-902(+)|eukprot:CAMPEP_0179299240 /NCGR_PEP_ID=MMETSP0797-20121207/46414_1 /TAXON_ID=47934 /ORGANISM="Dinophysis acuminata, Strain DAEP01" /LENGTH=242 /DNA_ID=CAMNT_0021008667 /DNA_START=174 /DNA_END=902 /DNA_ORIENTATION=-